MSGMAWTPEHIMNHTPPTVPYDVSETAAHMLKSLLVREEKGRISARSAQMTMARLLPPMNPVDVVPPICLDNIPTPTSPREYRLAMRRIYRAAIDGKCNLDSARKAMILTKTLWRAELEVASIEASRPKE